LDWPNLGCFGAKVIRVIRTTASGAFPLSTMKTINQQPIFILLNLEKNISPSILKMLLILKIKKYYWRQRSFGRLLQSLWK
jgi:branched-subunit amino acid transport protein AzlD